MRDSLFENIEAAPAGYSSIHFDRDDLLGLLGDMEAQENIESLRDKVAELKRVMTSREVFIDEHSNGNVVSLRRDVLASELDQIAEARTIERARYYVKRLERGV